MVQFSGVVIGIVTASGILLVMLRLFRRKTLICNCLSDPGKHVVITGATSGIGRATAMALAQRNWRVTLGCRNLNLGDHVRQEIVDITGNNNIHLQQLDLTERSSIELFAATFRDSPVHVLINNAGIMTAAPGQVDSFGNVTVDVGTNYLGTFYLTHLMLPHLKRLQDACPIVHPRIILVSSSLSSRGRLRGLLEPQGSDVRWDAMQGYADSKLACCLFAKELYRRFGTGPDKKFNVYCLFTGGMVYTGLFRHSLSSYSRPVQWFWPLFAKLLLKTPLEGCQSVIHCAVSSDVPGAHCNEPIVGTGSDHSGSGALYCNCVPIPWPENMNDMQQSQTLWQETMRFLNLHE